MDHQQHQYYQQYQPSYPPNQNQYHPGQVNGYSAPPPPVNGPYEGQTKHPPPPASFPTQQPHAGHQVNQGYQMPQSPPGYSDQQQHSFPSHDPSAPSPVLGSPTTAAPQPYPYQNTGLTNGYQPPPPHAPVAQPAPMTSRYPPGPPGPPSQQNYYPQQQQQMHQPPLHQQQQHPQSRLDPDAMPSVIQVIDDDLQKFYRADNVIFSTQIPAAVPPLVTSVKPESIVHDGGCARPQHIRATSYHVPITEDVLKNTSIPLGIVVTPFDESESEGNTIIPITASEIVRCNRCRAYMSPFMRFMDGGRRFQCGLCRHISEVPAAYFGHLDHTGQRLDKYERPELFLGSYEFKATAEFCRNSVLNCRRPHIIFAFELTLNSMPIIKRLTRELAAIIRENLPIDPLRPGSGPPLVGFMTYNSKIQVYDVKNDAQAHVICDIGQVFPVTTYFLADPVEHIDKIEEFLENLPNLFPEDELETESILGPVIEAALLTSQFEVSNWYINEVMPGENPAPQPRDPEKSIPSGKVYLFHCTLPTYGQDGTTPGRLKPRWTTSIDEVRKLLGSDKEKQILSPEQSKYYSTLAQKCVAEFGSGVELFLFPPVNGSYLDVATLGELVRLTGSGGIYKYYNEPGDRFITDLKYSLKSTFAFEAIMKGMFLINLNLPICNDISIFQYEHRPEFELVTMLETFIPKSPRTLILVALTLEIVLLSKSNMMINFPRMNLQSFRYVFVSTLIWYPLPKCFFFQVAILYTSVSGERRVRCHNLGLQTCSQVADVFRSACCDTLMNLLLRQSVSSLRLGEKTPEQVRENLISQSVKILTAYRKHCAQPGSSLGQLILPEALKLLPVYVCGALKCDAIDGGPEMTPDDKAFAQIRTLGASIKNTQVMVYPRLLRVEYEDDQLQSLKTTHIRCSEMRLNSPNGVCFLLENAFYLFVYIPSNPSKGQAQFIKNVFGVDNIQAIIPDNVSYLIF